MNIDEKYDKVFYMLLTIILWKKIQILNHLSIQGKQTCGYFQTPALQYILKNNLNKEEIIAENIIKNGIIGIKKNKN